MSQHKSQSRPAITAIIKVCEHASLVTERLMEADRLKMRRMTWLREHETCSSMGGMHVATGDTGRQ